METKPREALQEELARAVAYGIDLTLLKRNLSRTPTERLLAHRQALRRVLVFRRAGEESRERAPGHPRSPR